MNRNSASPLGCLKRRWRVRIIILCAFGVASASLANAAQSGQPAVAASPLSSEHSSAQAGQALQRGILLTREGNFSEAIPYLTAARMDDKDSYPATFNLALCDVAIGRFSPAIQLLLGLHQSGRAREDIDNLLSQAYIGSGDIDRGWLYFKEASSIDPHDERLYVFVADAFSAKQDYDQGIKVVDLGLQNIPSSARLHYERGMMLTLRDQFDSGKNDFMLARRLAPGTVLAYLAAAQETFLEGDLPGTIQAAREGIKSGQADYRLLSILGQALIRSGVIPGEKGFNEALEALEEAVAEKPDYPVSQIALGKLYLMENRLDDAISHLEHGSKLSPGDRSAYTSLAVAYRRKGETDREREVLAILARLNQEDAAKIAAPIGGRRSGYGSQQPNLSGNGR
jgi:tetratricopeptide (TPR) repeat protein